jgi:formylglycine-generating enzyme required for sulfatase activity
MLCPTVWRRVGYWFAALLFGLPAATAWAFPVAADEITDQLTLEMRIPKALSRAEERALKPKDQFKECDGCPQMVVVPAGEFMMGSPEDEEGHTSDEAPQHKVRFLTPFAVGRSAITFDEWDACVADRGCRNYRPPDRGWGRGRQPVIAIWWDDAFAYVKWLAQKTSKNYRLLSEAEREYVTRAGTTTPFWWGSSISSNQANYLYRGEEVQRKTLPVDSFEPNPWGLYQVHGNVSEWIGDCWHYDYTGAPSDGSAWTDAECQHPMLRGGGWNSALWELRSASRAKAAAFALVLPAIGMRVARPLR